MHATSSERLTQVDEDDLSQVAAMLWSRRLCGTASRFYVELYIIGRRGLTSSKPSTSAMGVVTGHPRIIHAECPHQLP